MERGGTEPSLNRCVLLAWFDGERRALVGSVVILLAFSIQCGGEEPQEDGEYVTAYGFVCDPGTYTDDADGDGYYTPLDCDDENADVHPGAQEVCNLIDDDCDGLMDEFTRRTIPASTIGRAGEIPVRYAHELIGEFDIPYEVDIGMDTDDEAVGIIAADIDSDGIEEAIIQSQAEGWVAAVTPDCSEGFLRRDLFVTSGSDRLRGSGDIDGDGDVDLVMFNVSSWSGNVWLNDGTGNFENSSEAVDWSVIGDGIGVGSLADSQELLDISDDGCADWVICCGLYGNTYCYSAEGRVDGTFAEPSSLITITTIEANSATLGYFTGDAYPDLLLGLRLEQNAGDPTCELYKLHGKAGGGFEQSPDFLFDIVDEIQGTAWGVDPDNIVDGWMRTVDHQIIGDGQSELLIILRANRDNDVGTSLFYVADPVDVNPSSGVQMQQIVVLIKEMVEETTTSDPRVYSVVAN